MMIVVVIFYLIFTAIFNEYKVVEEIAYNVAMFFDYVNPEGFGYNFNINWSFEIKIILSSIFTYSLYRRTPDEQGL